LDERCQADPTVIFNKTKMCKFHILGMCSKGTGCKFAHHKDELNCLPDLTRTKLCKTLVSTGVCENPACRFAHSQAEMRMVPENAPQLGDIHHGETGHNMFGIWPQNGAIPGSQDAAGFGKGPPFSVGYRMENSAITRPIPLTQEIAMTAWERHGDASRLEYDAQSALLPGPWMNYWSGSPSGLMQDVDFGAVDDSMAMMHPQHHHQQQTMQALVAASTPQAASYLGDCQAHPWRKASDMSDASTEAPPPEKQQQDLLPSGMLSSSSSTSNIGTFDGELKVTVPPDPQFDVNTQGLACQMIQGSPHAFSQMPDDAASHLAASMPGSCGVFVKNTFLEFGEQQKPTTRSRSVQNASGRH